MDFWLPEDNTFSNPVKCMLFLRTTFHQMKFILFEF